MLQGRSALRILGATTILHGCSLIVGCGDPPPADPAGAAYRAVQASPEIETELFDGRVRIVSVYKVQIVTAYRDRELPEAERITHVVSSVYAPYRDFWSGYLGDESTFTDWTVRQSTDLTDPRVQIPTGLEFDALLDTTIHPVTQLTGRIVPESVWYLVYGPGWTNMGGLGDATMVVDFFGVPDTSTAESFVNDLPHEINHQLFGAGHADDADRTTALQRVIDEGFAVYVNQVYWDELAAPQRHLGYTQEEFTWAIENEPMIVERILPWLANTDRETHSRLTARSTRLWADAPGAIGYFIGLRIVESYVERHGPESWRDLYDLPIARIVEESDNRLWGRGRGGSAQTERGVR